MGRALLVRVPVAVLLLALGLAVGAAATFVHPLWWGLPLSALTVTACLVALPGGWWRRLPYSLGVAGAVATFVPTRADGGYVIGGDLPGYLLLGGALVVLLTGITTVRGPLRPPPEPPEPSERPRPPADDDEADGARIS